MAHHRVPSSDFQADLAEDDAQEGRVAVGVSHGEVPVVRADLADPLPAFVDQLQAVLRLPGNLSLE